MSENNGGRNSGEPEYTTPGEPLESEQYRDEEDDRDATTGPPLEQRDGAGDDVEYTTPGNPFESPEHEAEEHLRHATPGAPLEQEAALLDEDDGDDDI
ncbi:hypothetical protein GCM10027416_30750 [Okibacterium endophyticum]